jgi:hypothetical protein
MDSAGKHHQACGADKELGGHTHEFSGGTKAARLSITG